jgi:hypothetical protein
MLLIDSDRRSSRVRCRRDRQALCAEQAARPGDLPRSNRRVVTIGTQFYQLIVVPLQIPQPVAWIAGRHQDRRRDGARDEHR